MKSFGAIGKVAAMMAMAGAIMENPSTGIWRGNRPDNMIDLSPKEPPIPKGCKEYFFDKFGGFSTDKMLYSRLVFKCYALNDKSAKKKFLKWSNQQQFNETQKETVHS